MNRAIDTLPALPCPPSTAVGPALHFVRPNDAPLRSPTENRAQVIEDRPARLTMNAITTTTAPAAFRALLDPTADDDVTVLDAFAARVESDPEALFDSQTYDAIDRQAAPIASALARLGIGTGDRVAIVSRTGLRLDAVMGVMATGAAFVALDGHDPLEAALLARRAGCMAVIGGALPGLSLPVVDPDTAAGGYVESACAWPGSDADEVACFVVDGSEAVALTHREMREVF